MQVFAHSAGVVLVAFAAHLVLWRVRLPVRQTRALLRLFVGVLAADVCLGLAVGAVSGLAFGLDGYQALHVCLVVLSLTMAYIITYSAFEADSPTLVMVRALDSAGGKGLEEAAFHAMLSDEVLMLPRLRDLLRDGMAVAGPDGRYTLTAKGRLMTKFIGGYRVILGVPKGG